MSKHLKSLQIRPAVPDDAERIVAWCEHEPHMMRSAQTQVFCVENGKPVTFATMQAVGLISNLGPNPEATELEKALALREVVDAASNLFDEVYFFAGSDKDAALEKIALAHGFVREEWRVYRKIHIGG